MVVLKYAFATLYMVWGRATSVGENESFENDLSIA